MEDKAVGRKVVVLNRAEELEVAEQERFLEQETPVLSPSPYLDYKMVGSQGGRVEVEVGAAEVEELEVEVLPEETVSKRKVMIYQDLPRYGSSRFSTYGSPRYGFAQVDGILLSIGVDANKNIGDSGFNGLQKLFLASLRVVG